jgi:hypothetical protein
VGEELHYPGCILRPDPIIEAWGRGSVSAAEEQPLVIDSEVDAGAEVDRVGRTLRKVLRKAGAVGLSVPRFYRQVEPCHSTHD